MTAAEFRAHVAKQMSEATLQTKVIGLARELGYERIYHTYDSRRSAKGYPDLHLVSARRRRSIFAELKTMRGVVSPDQLLWLNDLRAAGVEAYVWRPIDLLDDSIAAILNRRD
jgi:hypothetical protein